MEATSASETPVGIYQTRRAHITEDGIIFKGLLCRITAWKAQRKYCSNCELLMQRKVKQTRHNCDWHKHKNKKERELCRDVQIRGSEACYRDFARLETWKVRFIFGNFSSCADVTKKNRRRERKDGEGTKGTKERREKRKGRKETKKRNKEIKTRREKEKRKNNRR
jgi:hypothetical protein